MARRITQKRDEKESKMRKPVVSVVRAGEDIELAVREAISLAGDWKELSLRSPGSDKTQSCL